MRIRVRLEIGRGGSGALLTRIVPGTLVGEVLPGVFFYS